mmetsp:Transcript_17257/g.57905  ORF Transcript_17257/g.57905 Transcript_17257/m.57905 type:complete len:229 (+) Transcript_17257:265-951(+)
MACAVRSLPRPRPWAPTGAPTWTRTCACSPSSSWRRARTARHKGCLWRPCAAPWRPSSCSSPCSPSPRRSWWASGTAAPQMRSSPPPSGSRRSTGPTCRTRRRLAWRTATTRGPGPRPCAWASRWCSTRAHAARRLRGRGSTAAPRARRTSASWTPCTSDEPTLSAPPRPLIRCSSTQPCNLCAIRSRSTSFDAMSPAELGAVALTTSLHLLLPLTLQRCLAVLHGPP